MKWAVVGLCLLGSVAAAAAALLVNALRFQTTSAQVLAAGGGAGEVTVLFARRTLPVLTVIDSSVVDLKIMRTEQAPAHYVSNPVEVVGKVLTKPIIEGQPFTAVSFADPGSAQQLAAVIPAGKRTVGISVTNFAGLDGLLYPGSMVDVMVSLKPGDGAEATRREAFTSTLLENIQVLAIEQQTVVSPSNKTINQLDGPSRANDAHCVTLLVDSKQAKALQLAMAEGTLSLALRNPLDAANADKDAVWFQSLIGHGIQPAESERVVSPVSTESKAAPIQPHWDTVVMRAGMSETQSFPMPLPEVAKPDAR